MHAHMHAAGAGADDDANARGDRGGSGKAVLMHDLDASAGQLRRPYGGAGDHMFRCFDTMCFDVLTCSPCVKCTLGIKPE